MAISPDHKHLEISPFIHAMTISRMYEEENVYPLEQLLEAERTISTVSGTEKLALESIPYPESGFYLFWKALICMEEKKYTEALTLLDDAVKNGLTYERVNMYKEYVLGQQGINKLN